MPLIALIALWVSIVCAALYGWVINLITVVSNFAIMETPELIVRIVGVPLGFIGMLMGWFY